MADKIEDSLDALPARSSPNPRDDREKSLMYALRQKFVTSLSKLQSMQTQQIALSEIRKMIDQNSEPQHIRLFISLMKSLKAEGTSSSTKENQILVFSIMAELLKQRLVDPIDKPPSCLKTSFRIVEILHKYFSDTTNTVQQACSRVLIDLGRYVLGAENPDMGSVDSESMINVLFVPLASILKSGVDKASQSTAAVCINEMVQYWMLKKSNGLYQKNLESVSAEMLNVVLRLNCEYHEIFMCMVAFIDYQGLAFFRNKLLQVLSKILGVINRLEPKSSKETTNNFNSYMSKVQVCQILERVGYCLQGEPELKAKVDELDVLTALERASRNRVIQVQTAAQRAMKVWKGEIVPSAAGVGSRKSAIISLQDARNKAKRERSRSREEKINFENKFSSMQENLNDLVKGGWGPHSRANKYTKKYSGVGGGQNSKMSRTPSPVQPNNAKSHKQHLEELRQVIKRGSKEHRGQDKFSYYQQSSPKKASPPQRKQRDQHQESLDFELQEDEGDQNVNLGAPSRGYYGTPSDIGAPRSQVGNPSQLSPTSKLGNNQYAVEQMQARPSAKVGNGVKANNKGVRSQQQSLEPVMNQRQMKDLLAHEEEYINQSMSSLNDQINEVMKMKKMSQLNSRDPVAASAPYRQDSFKKDPASKAPNSPGLLLQSNLELNPGDLDSLSENDGETIDMNEILNESDLDCLGEDKKKYLKRYNLQQTNSRDSLKLSQSFPKKFLEPKTFTLNPVNPDASRFNSYDQKKRSEDEQAQGRDEEIMQEVTDYYAQASGMKKTREEPRVQSDKFEMLYKFAQEEGSKIDQRGSDRFRQSEIYQEMIKNPPRVPHLHQIDKSLSLEPREAPEEEEEPSTDNIVAKWERVLELVEDEEINEAYMLTFQMDDPIYLLRLMLLTQTPLKKLTPANTCLLWQKFLQIYQHRLVDNIFVQMFSEGMKMSKGLKNVLSIEETNDLLLELYDVSGKTKGKLSFAAANLYNQIDESIHRRT